ncbi:MAG: glycerophosphoryl diester phosphodiesterase membrane domain-containing protein, partial [Gemmatimonadales bacterium]|nr:glycerophosphoryl diester phosphodiesterase membrane domain-containing protein [Gemmatimonadales bacterium]
MTPVASERPANAWAWAADELRHEWRPLVAYQVIVSVAGAVLFTPLLTLLLRRIMGRTGSVAISNFDLTGFFLSPVGLAFLLALLAGTVALFALLHAGLVLLTAHHERRGDPVAVLRRVLRHLPRMTVLGLLQLERLLLVAIPFAAVLAVLALPLLRAHDINYYLAEAPPEWRRLLRVGTVLSIGYAALALWLAARWQLAVPFLLLERRSPRAALAASADAARGRAWPIVFTLGGWWLMLFVAQFVLGIAVTGAAR